MRIMKPAGEHKVNKNRLQIEKKTSITGDKCELFTYYHQIQITELLRYRKGYNWIFPVKYLSKSIIARTLSISFMDWMVYKVIIYTWQTSQNLLFPAHI